MCVRISLPIAYVLGEKAVVSNLCLRKHNQSET